jgi:hypothetical protein
MHSHPEKLGSFNSGDDGLAQWPLSRRVIIFPPWPPFSVVFFPHAYKNTRNGGV